MKADLVFRDVASIDLEPLAVVATVLQDDDRDFVEGHDIAEKFCYICRAAAEYLKDFEAFDTETSQGRFLRATYAALDDCSNALYEAYTGGNDGH